MATSNPDESDPPAKPDSADPEPLPNPTAAAEAEPGSGSETSTPGRPVADAIARSPEGRIPFAEAMRLALYAEDVGYYASGNAPIGTKGDFITSVSAGSCFGTLLARHYTSLWKKAGSPTRFLAVEQGAHDGQLASDILDALEESTPQLHRAIHLFLVEPSPHLRSRQSERLSPRLGDRLTHVGRPAELADHPPVKSGGPGIFFANELLDAFPVHRVRLDGGTWHERYVTCESDGGPGRGRFVFCAGPPSSGDVESALAHLPTDLPDGYETEISLEPSRWIHEVAGSGFRGEICLIDYGFTRDEYYAPHRTDGTLRRYRGHRTDGRVLEDLGAADITAHVEFTSLIEAAEAAGFALAEFTDQHHFLVRAATSWLGELEAAGATGETDPRIRQFQTLIHPTSMGRAFKILRFTKS